MNTGAELEVVKKLRHVCGCDDEIRQGYRPVHICDDEPGLTCQWHSKTEGKEESGDVFWLEARCARCSEYVVVYQYTLGEIARDIPAVLYRHELECREKSTPVAEKPAPVAEKL